MTTLPIRSALSTGRSRPSLSCSKLDCSWPNHFNFLPYFWITPVKHVVNYTDLVIIYYTYTDLMNWLQFLRPHQSFLILYYPRVKKIFAFPLAFSLLTQFENKFWIKIESSELKLAQSRIRDADWSRPLTVYSLWVIPARKPGKTRFLDFDTWSLWKYLSTIKSILHVLLLW